MLIAAASKNASSNRCQILDHCGDWESNLSKPVSVIGPYREESSRGIDASVELARWQNRSTAGLPRSSLVAVYGVGSRAKRGCRIHCCTVGVAARAAHGEIECRDAFGVIVFAVD